MQNFEAISERVHTVTEQETSVRSAMEEQGIGSKNILDSVGGLNNITGEVTKSALSIVDGSHKVINDSKTLEQITEEINQGMQEMATGAEQINVAVHKVNDISTENKRQIKVLMDEVSHFKIE